MHIDLLFDPFGATWHDVHQGALAAVASVRSVWTGTVAGVGGFLVPNPPPPVILGGFGPRMAQLAGRVADGINLPDGPSLVRLLDLAGEARATSGRDQSSFVVTVSSTPTRSTIARLEDLGVDRVVAFVQAPFVPQARRLAVAIR